MGKLEEAVIMPLSSYIQMGKDYPDRPCKTSYNRRTTRSFNKRNDLKKFNGKNYVFIYSFFSEYKAKIYANKWRKEGFLARTHKSPIQLGSHIGDNISGVFVRDPNERRF